MRKPPGVQESVPEDTLLVFHTLHVPHGSADPNMWEADAFLPQHVAQLNSAGRQARAPPTLCDLSLRLS